MRPGMQAALAIYCHSTMRPAGGGLRDEKVMKAGWPGGAGGHVPYTCHLRGHPTRTTPRANAAPPRPGGKQRQHSARPQSARANLISANNEACIRVRACAANSKGAASASGRPSARLPCRSAQYRDGTAARNLGVRLYFQPAAPSVLASPFHFLFIIPVRLALLGMAENAAAARRAETPLKCY